MIISSFMEPVALLEKYFPDHAARSIVCAHSRMVADRALAIARSVDGPVDLRFIEEAALLHDIGICMTAAPDIHCSGPDHYITHGIHGRMILEQEGFPRHALVCERHIGVGITVADIREQSLPLPCRDMMPTCIEEEIICYADLFYSKKPGSLSVEQSVAQVRSKLTALGHAKVELFDLWQKRFTPRNPVHQNIIL